MDTNAMQKQSTVSGVMRLITYQLTQFTANDDRITATIISINNDNINNISSKGRNYKRFSR